MLAKLLKPFHFKVFFSNKYVHAQVLDKLSNVAVASVCSNNRAFDYYLGEKVCKNDEKACQLLGKMLANKVKERQVCPVLVLSSMPALPRMSHPWLPRRDGKSIHSFIAKEVYG